jgi:hypothetical protein
MSEIDPIIVREELDTILANEITSFIDIEARIAALANEEKGLKCPIVSHSYDQKNLLDSVQYMAAAASAAGSSPSKKKKRVVRRKSADENRVCG